MKSAAPTSTVVFTKASTQQWIHEFGTGTVSHGDDQGDTLVGIATDPQGNAITAGYTTGAFSGFSNPNGVPQDFIAKYDPAGTQLWLQQFGTANGDQLSGVAVDTQGNIAVAGVTEGAYPGFTNPNHFLQAVVEKLDGSGHQLWLQQLNLSTSTTIDGVAVDSQGNVLVCGQASSSTYQFYPDPYYASQPTNIFVEKLNGGTGAEEWIQQFGNGSATDSVSSIAVDSQGNPVLVGTSSGAFPGTMNYPGVNPSQPFVLKLSASTGQTLWVQQSSNSYSPSGFAYNAVAVDGQGNVVADGEGAGPECLVFKFNGTNGNTMWQQNFGGAQGCLAGGLALDTDGSILAGGYATGTFVPSVTAMAFTTNTDDIFLAKFTAGGQPVSIQQFGTGNEIAEQDSEISSAVSIATDAQNNTFVGGMTTGAFSGSTNTNGAQEIFLAKFGPQ